MAINNETSFPAPHEGTLFDPRRVAKAGSIIKDPNKTSTAHASLTAAQIKSHLNNPE